MSSTNPVAQGRARVFLLTMLSAALPLQCARAGVLDGPSAYAQVGPGSNVERWTLSNFARLDVIPGGATGKISAASSASVNIVGGSVTANTPAILGDAAIRLTGSTGAGATARIERSTVVDTAGRALSLLFASANIPQSSATIIASQLTGAQDGVFQASGGLLRVEQGSRIDGTTGTGVLFTTGRLEVAGQSVINGGVNGVTMTDGTRFPGENQGRFLIVDGSSITGQTGSGILVGTVGNPTLTLADIALVNGASVTGGDGVAVRTASNAETDLSIDSSDIVGDMVSEGGRFDISLGNTASVTGRMRNVSALSLDSGSTWNVTGDSDVHSLAMSADSALAFQKRADGARSAVTIHGDLTGTGGEVVFNTVMNAGGALGAQQTDRLLVEGNVTTTGTTWISFPGQVEGDGEDTDANGNGVVDASEGISLVQVAGTSRADAFALKGGYVAAGGYQYTLHAFGPGQTDPAQNALANGAALNWDYRLGSRACTEAGCEPVNPPPPPPPPPCEDCGPVDPVDPPPPERDAVVPQLPSYLSAPAALLTYGDMLNDGLRQRLGDIRGGQSSDPLGGEVFARYLGGQLRYSSNRSFRNYGYDFDQQVNALQLGGSLISLDRDQGTLRVGWALDHGTTRVSPQAVDGDSSAKYRATGGTAWITWQAGSGWWVDAVVAGQRYRGDVSTDMRGADVARIRATGTTLSAEVGKPFTLGGDWVLEPRAQVKYQTLRFDGFVDADGLSVDLGTARQTSVRIGALLSRITNPRLAPYARLDLTRTGNGDPTADVSSEAWNVRDRFGSGRVGNAVRVAAGATSQLTPHLQLYGEGTYQRFVGSYGMRGWAGNLGVRVTF